MAISLTKPVVGSTGWGPAVNGNFQTLEDFCNNVASALLNAVPVMVGANGSAGTKGLVPEPGPGDGVNFLRGDGAWASAAAAYRMVGHDEVNLGLGGHQTGTPPAGTAWGLVCYITPAAGQMAPLWLVVSYGPPVAYDVGNGDGADTTSTVQIIWFG
jgi:hypothetical protein